METPPTTIFTYGILRKLDWLQWALNYFDLEGASVTPDKIKGYVPYHSNGVNMLFPVNQRQKDKYPDGDFIVEGSVVQFYGTLENIKEIHKYIDLLEMAYTKKIITTESGERCCVYVMNEILKRKKIINLYGIGLVIYSDTILEEAYVTKTSLLSTNMAEATEEEEGEEKQFYTYEKGKEAKPITLKDNPEEYNYFQYWMEQENKKYGGI